LLLEKSNLCIVFSSNLALESAVLNSKLRLKFRNENFKVMSISGFYRSNFYIEFINFNLQNTLKLLETKIKKLSKILMQYSSPLFCIGESNRARNLSLELFYTFKYLLPTATFLSIRPLCNSEGCSFLNILPLTKKDFIFSQNLLIINLDDTTRLYKLLKFFSAEKKTFWFATHNSSLCFKTANFIVPIVTYLEESQMFINLEQKPQKNNKSNPRVRKL
jgi:NADH dehydrogenase/NADH:ubiquinone oxidoreductase subunit G